MKTKQTKLNPVSEQMLTVRVTKKLMSALNKTSRKNGMSRSDFVRSSLERSVA
jgi:metal-responsive CopG/Arc/MetJ family transcriptional regulator